MIVVDTDVRFRRSDRALSRRVGTEVLVTTPGDPDVHELSGGAMAVWADLEVPRTLGELVADLAGAHGTPPEEIREDVEACLLALMACGVVEEVRGLHG